MKKTIYYIMIGCLLLGTGCSDWLSVNPKDKVEQKEMFSDENGFKNALIGNYIMLKDGKLVRIWLSIGRQIRRQSMGIPPLMIIKMPKSKD